MEEKDIIRIRLKNAVAHLKNTKKITLQEDIAKALGVGKSAVSSYINGTQPASKQFIKKFETVYKISLSDFDNSEIIALGDRITPADRAMMRALKKHLLKLEAKVYNKDIKELNEEFNQDTILGLSDLID